MISIAKEVIHLDVKICAVKVGDRYQAWWSPINPTPTQQERGLFRFTETSFKTPDEAIAVLKKTVDSIHVMHHSFAKKERARFERLGVPRQRTQIIADIAGKGANLNPVELESLRELWQELLARAGGDIYRGYIIIAYREENGWTWAWTHSSVHYVWQGNRAQTYPTRSKALLMARRAILSLGVWRAISDALGQCKIISLVELMNLSSNCADFWS